MANRNKNIFVRKETAWSCVNGNKLPVFAEVVKYEGGNVHYLVDYPQPMGKSWRWHYSDATYLEEAQSSGTYIKPLEEFLTRFTPDFENEIARFQ